MFQNCIFYDFVGAAKGTTPYLCFPVGSQRDGPFSYRVCNAIWGDKVGGVRGDVHRTGLVLWFADLGQFPSIELLLLFATDTARRFLFLGCAFSRDRGIFREATPGCDPDGGDARREAATPTGAILCGPFSRDSQWGAELRDGGNVSTTAERDTIVDFLGGGGWGAFDLARGFSPTGECSANTFSSTLQWGRLLQL